MPLITTYDQWIKDTYSRFDQRSDDLKKIDDAIKGRNEQAAKAALVKWIDGQNAKRQDWHKSVRNQNKAVEKLYKELGILGAAPTFSDQAAKLADSEAKSILRSEIRRASAQIFTGKELRFKEKFLTFCQSQCRNQSSKMERFKTGAGNAAGTAANIGGAAYNAYGLASNLEKIIKTIMGEGLSSATRDEIVRIIFGTTIEEFVHNAAPFFGLVSSGAKALIAWIGVAQKISQAEELMEHYGDVRPGDAATAIHAMVEIIDKQITSQAIEAGIRTTAFTTKGILTLADGGTASTAAVGAIESVAVILNTLTDIVREGRQKDAGNRLIAAGKIDVELFNKCPVLGCYYITTQDHSTIMNFEIANMGRANWRQEAERLKYAIVPVIKIAAELIEKSRIEIVGMAVAKGVYQSTILQKINLYRKSKGFGQDNNMTAVGDEFFDLFDPTSFQ